jgi:hypothetical protein
MNFEKLKYNKHFTYTFPYGEWGIPRIHCLSGKFKGLEFDLNSSAVVTGEFAPEMQYQYTFTKMWKEHKEDVSVSENDKDELRETIGNLVFNYIRHHTKKNS